MADLTDTDYASEAPQGYGSQLLVGDGASPEVFQAIAEVTSIQPGSVDTNDVDRTHLRSPNAHHEHQPGLRDSAAFELTGNLRLDHESQNNTSPRGLIYLHANRSIRNFKIKLPTGTYWPFTGYVNKFQLGQIVGTDKISFTAGIMPTQDYTADLPTTE